MPDNGTENMDSKLKKILIPDAHLPERVFSRSFGKYLFFDADICSSNALISTLQEIAGTCFSLHSQVDVYASSSGIFLGILGSGEDWITGILEFAKKLQNDGDFGGLILMDACQKWIVYQPRSVDVGIFAFDCAENVEEIVPSLKDSFFGCKEILAWSKGETQRDIDMREIFDANFLNALMMNYYKC